MTSNGPSTTSSERDREEPAITEPKGRSLSGKVAVVTGASSGIGLTIASLLADSGATVHALARRHDAMVAGAGAERIASGRILPHALSVTEENAVERVIHDIGGEEGIHILVSAAGANIPKRTLGEIDAKTWDEMIAVNLNGAFYVLHAALPYLRASHGDVVFINSVSAAWPDISGPAYQAAKSGLLALARATALEEHARGVRVSTILPGQVNTPMLDQRPSPPDERSREASIQPEDVAAACLFLITLPSRVYVPEMTLLPSRFQALGKTSTHTLPP